MKKRLLVVLFLFVGIAFNQTYGQIKLSSPETLKIQVKKMNAKETKVENVSVDKKKILKTKYSKSVSSNDIKKMSVQFKGNSIVDETMSKNTDIKSRKRKIDNSKTVKLIQRVNQSFILNNNNK